ncbi:MAG: DUF4404 family protein [bacterium]
MIEKTLREQLKELRAEVDVLEAEHAEARARLDSLISSIEHQLENVGDKAHRQTLSGEIHEYVEDFENKHPGIIGVLDKISVTLSNMGI